MNALGGTRRRAVRNGLIIAAAVVVLGGIGLALLVFSGGRRTYPTTPEGWAARWNAAAAEFGRTPGENWDLWLDVLSEIEGETDPAIVGPKLDTLAGLDRFTIPVPASIGTVDIWETAVPDFGALRDALRVIAPEIKASLEHEDTDAAADWIERAWSLARVAEASGTLIGGMVQAAVVNTVFETVRPFADVVAGDPQIEELIRSAPIPGIAWTFRMEQETGVIFIESMIADLPLAAHDQTAIYEDVLTDWVAYGTTGDTDARDRVQAVFDRLERNRIYRLRRAALDLILPSVERAVGNLKATRVERDALLVMLALERFWDEHGSYPHALDQLVPEQLAAIPADPFADNAPLRYRLVDPDSDDPMTAYVLYSVGHNGTDEGGTENPSLVGRGLTDPDHGADHILNRLPPPPRPTGIFEDDPDDQPNEQPADQADEQPSNPAEAVP